MNFTTVVARILAVKPEFILLDEPTSGLDPISTMKIEDSLRKLKKDYTVYHDGKPVVIGGHISKGVKARRLLRIYFAWLPELKAFLVGHVGEHLPTETHVH